MNTISKKLFPTVTDICILSLVALIPRIVLFLAYAKDGTQPSVIGDEAAYLDRAVAFTAVICGNHSSSTLAAVYDGGHWPPLQPLALACGISLFQIGNLMGARLTEALIGCIVVVPLYFLGREIGGRKAGIVAALIGSFSTTMIVFSAFLSSESLYLVMFLSAILGLLQVFKGDRSAAVTTGICFGLAALARANALLPFAVAIAAIIIYTRQRALVTLVATIAFAVVLPWEATLYHYERRIVPLSTVVGSNLYVGNNDAWPAWPDKGFVMGGGAFELMSDRLWYLGGGELGRMDIVGTKIARRWIVAHPARFVRLCIGRLIVCLSPDNLLQRHIRRGEYPPFGKGMIAYLLISTIIQHWFIIGFGIVGLIIAKPRERNLALSIIAATVAAPIVSMASTRLAMPALVVLIPFAARAICHIAAPLIDRSSRRTKLTAQQHGHSDERVIEGEARGLSAGRDTRSDRGG